MCRPFKLSPSNQAIDDGFFIGLDGKPSRKPRISWPAPPEDVSTSCEPTELYRNQDFLIRLRQAIHFCHTSCRECAQRRCRVGARPANFLLEPCAPDSLFDFAPIIPVVATSVQFSSIYIASCPNQLQLAPLDTLPIRQVSPFLSQHTIRPGFCNL